MLVARVLMGPSVSVVIVYNNDMIGEYRYSYLIFTVGFVTTA
jgi:hypothetical protein